MFTLALAVLPVARLACQDVPRTEARFSNPVLWEDLADLDIVRVGDAYYYSASNMHYSPGAPILRSYDLVHWQYIGHSVPALDFGPNYNLDGGSAYVRGTWASFFGYRAAKKTFYWGGCIDFKKTYLYAAPEAEGPWQRHAVIDKCYYDAGLLIDDDDTPYVAYGNTAIRVAQLSSDATSEVKSQEVFHSPADIGPLEGSRFYKIRGNYYIFVTHPPDGEYVLRSTAGPFGPYSLQKLLLKVRSAIPGAGAPHQGGIVQTKDGKWYYMAFVDAYPGGRIPVLAPLKWKEDGWPEVDLVDGEWGATYPLPGKEAASDRSSAGEFFDSFSNKTLGAEWEWNHNPDNGRWTARGGLNLSTATVTDDLYAARNTLTHRILGPESSATIVMDSSKMKDGDAAGLAMLRDSSAWVGVVREGGLYQVVEKSGLTMSKNWKTLSTGTVEESIKVGKGKVWLRVSADIRPGPNRTATFSYSADGKSFHAIGKPFELNHQWPFFMGYRFGIFNYATQSLGGSVLVESFRLAKSPMSQQ